MRLLVVAGMPRAGTTFLYHNLHRHPGIFVPFRKETNYFNVNFDQPESEYRALFAGAGENQVCCDGSPLCFMDPGSDERIANFAADWRIIVSVRDPIDWTLSFYAQIQSFTYDMPSYAEFVAGYELAIGDKTLRLDFQDDFAPRRIERLREAFGDRMLLFSSALLKRDPLRVLSGIEDFLGLSRHFRRDNFDRRRINASGRQNVKWLSHFLNRESVIEWIHRLFPRGLIVEVRRRLDALEAARGRGREYRHRPEDVALSRGLFAEQQQWVDDLFAAGEIQLGDGSPLAASAGDTPRVNP